jgi:hypothetical protein
MSGVVATKGERIPPTEGFPDDEKPRIYFLSSSQSVDQILKYVEQLAIEN